MDIETKENILNATKHSILNAFENNNGFNFVKSTKVNFPLNKKISISITNIPCTEDDYNGHYVRYFSEEFFKYLIKDLFHDNIKSIDYLNLDSFIEEVPYFITISKFFENIDKDSVILTSNKISSFIRSESMKEYYSDFNEAKDLQNVSFSTVPSFIGRFKTLPIYVDSYQSWNEDFFYLIKNPKFIYNDLIKYSNLENEVKEIHLEYEIECEVKKIIINDLKI